MTLQKEMKKLHGASKNEASETLKTVRIDMRVHLLAQSLTRSNTHSLTIRMHLC